MEKSVFVIDDDSDVREVIIFALENDGYKVMSAENGLAGLNLLKTLSPENFPGLIIVDNLMPEMDGVTFIQEIKEKHPDTFGKIPVVFSSAMGSMDEENPFLKDVVTLYKPMELDELLITVKKYCA